MMKRSAFTSQAFGMIVVERLKKEMGRWSSARSHEEVTDHHRVPNDLKE
jgi:hypothetical protein